MKLARLLNPTTIVSLSDTENGSKSEFTVRVRCVYLEMIVTSNQDLFIFQMTVE